MMKSEALYECVKVMMKGVFDWKKLGELSNAAILDRKKVVKLMVSCTNESIIL